MRPNRMRAVVRKEARVDLEKPVLLQSADLSRPVNK
jgi:hypothetical protein